MIKIMMTALCVAAMGAAWANPPPPHGAHAPAPRMEIKSAPKPMPKSAPVVSKPLYEEVRCHECKGKGKIRHWWGSHSKCSKCHGKGYIMRELPPSPPSHQPKHNPPPHR